MVVSIFVQCNWLCRTGGEASRKMCVWIGGGGSHCWMRRRRHGVQF
jgi:hypothetical protein